MNSCAGILTTGERRGQSCGKRGIALINGTWYCGRHRPNPQHPPLLCSYDPPFPLGRPQDYMPIEDPSGEQKVASLNGYINIRVGAPVLNGGESVPLALISSISPGTQAFNKESLARELRSAIGEIVERPDVYRLGCTSLEGLCLEKITYDTTYNIFIAHLHVAP